MAESMKRAATPSTSASNNKVRKTATASRPAIVGTKASQARAKAIKTAQSTAKPNAIKKRKPADQDNETKSYHTVASSLKQRPNWDLRGKVTDMTALYQLNLDKLKEMEEFKRELEVLKQEKDSEEKENLQKAAELRTELVNMERDHATKIQELHANHRIEYQQLEDENLNYSRKLNTMDIEIADARNRVEAINKNLSQIQQENESLRTYIKETTESYENAETTIRNLKQRVNKLNISIHDREKEIKEKEKKVANADNHAKELRAELDTAEAKRDKLLSIIKDLEANSTNKKAVTKMSV